MEFSRSSAASRPLHDIDSILRTAPVIPVLIIDEAEHAVPIAEALVEGGLPVIEVTLRTPRALEAIRAMKGVPGAIVGAGTVLTPAQYREAVDAGAEFAVSPGLTDTLGREAANGPLPFLPGVANAGDIMRALEFGFTRLKFFPATAAGGPPVLKSLSSVFGQLRFCPTGGITAATAPEWLSIPSVLCVGGSWLLPPGTESDTSAIRERARQAATLGRRH